MAKIQTVAVIGAGVSGIVAAKHLESRGITVTIFERASQAGGVWVYDERGPLEPDFAARNPSKADFDPEQTSRTLSLDLAPIDKLSLLHAPPGPCYSSLTNNVSTPQLALQGQPWPIGTEDFINHKPIKDYLQTAARSLKSTVFSFNTRVEHVIKLDRGWLVSTSKLIPGHGLESTKQLFHAVVVASGHYHAPYIPDIPGLVEWKRRWPARLSHSKTYRDPNGFEGQNVLLIGGGVSSMDIAREIQPAAGTVYRSSRNGKFDIPDGFLPQRTIRIGEVSEFLVPEEYNALHDTHVPIPSKVVLKDGTTLHNIHRVIICTGYVTSYPFLPQFHRDRLSPEQADSTCLVTDGTQVHNLYKDIFYIPDPTLAFIGKPYFTATFTLFEFQAIALAAVYAGLVDMPSVEEMRVEYEERVHRKGVGKSFHSLRGEEVEYVRELVEWVNSRSEERQFEPIQGHTKEWLEAYAVRAERIRERLQMKEDEARTRSAVATTELR